MSEKINKKPKSKGLWAKLAALMLVLLMTTTQNTLMGQGTLNIDSKSTFKDWCNSTYRLGNLTKDVNGLNQGSYDVNKYSGQSQENKTLCLNKLKIVGTASINVACNLDVEGETGSIGLSFTVSNGTLNAKGGTISGTVTVKNGCILKVNGGTVSGTVTVESGGELIVSAGTFDISKTIIENGGKLTVSGGTVSGNITVDSGCTLNVKDEGTIEGHVTVSGGSFTMTGGSITKSTTSGVEVVGGAFTMTGGSITGNTTGVDMQNGTVTLGGTAEISGNTNRNLYLASGKTVEIVSGGFSDGAIIWVTTQEKPKESPVAVTSGTTPPDCFRYFFSDESYDVDYGVDNQVVLKRVYRAQILGGGFYYTVQAAIGDAKSDQTVQMIANSKETISFSTKTVTLDLNGCTLTGNGSSVITVSSGYLTLKDSGSDGKVTGGSATNGGGVYVKSGGTFEMTGGIISDNSATTSGGGVYVASNGIFNMTGGTITANTATTSGGGVYADETVKLGGTAKITGNTKTDGTQCNLYLPTKNIVKFIGNTPLETGAQIGVTKTIDKNPVAVTDICGTDCSGFFNSDENHMVYNDVDSNVVMLKKKSQNENVQFEGTAKVFSKLSDAINDENASNYTIKLLANIDKEDTQIIEKKITINLNGYSLKCKNNNDVVIKVGNEGNLTLVNNDGIISGGKTAGVSVNGNNASFTMNGGTITGGSTGVQVSGNAASFTMNGGTITENTTGVEVSSNGNVTLGGTAKIINNTTKNLYLAKNKTVTIGSNGLSSEASIGVTLQTYRKANNYVNVTTDKTNNYAKYFTSDKAGYIAVNDNGYVAIKSGTSEDIKAEIDDKGGRYTTVQNAISKANSSVKMINDSEETSDITVNEPLSLNLNGKILKGNVTINNGGTIKGKVNIQSGYELTIADGSNTNDANIIIEDGGQLITYKDVTATVRKTVKNEDPNSGSGKYQIYQWYLICSPIQNQLINNVIGYSEEGDIYGSDLYQLSYDGSTWLNYENPDNDFYYGNNRPFEFGRSYLYATEKNRVLEFKGTVNHDVLRVDMSIHKGYNLVGNPSTQDVKLSRVECFYRLNSDGTWQSQYISENDTIKPMDGVLVIADEVDSITLSAFTKGQPKRDSESSDYIKISVANSQHHDRAYAILGDEGYLSKIEHRSEEAPMLYIPQNGNDYAIASMGESTKEFPLSFEAKTTSKFVISMSSNRDLDYLHLIDHETGDDIDMLADGEYEFIGSPDDSKDRFTVRLEADSEEATEQNFAYQVGSELVVSGEGMLQVFDVLGRVVLSEEVNGSTRVSVGGLRTGAYIVRIIGNDIKTQKIIIR